MRRWGACLALLLLAGCGQASDPGTAPQWLERGEASFAAGETHAQRAAALEGDAARAAWSEAVAAWRLAGGDLVRAFRLMDPDPKLRDERAMLAFRIGRAWSKAARQGSDETQRGVLAERALFWFRHAMALGPSLQHAHYERAVLFDSDIEDVRDLTRARECYQRYVDADGDDVSREGREAPRLTRARQRLEELSAGPADGD